MRSTVPRYNTITDDDLTSVATFHGSPRALVARVRDLWDYPGAVAEEVYVDRWSRSRVLVRLVTNGWSDNKALVGVLQASLFGMFWSKSERGGLHEYDVPGAQYDEVWDFTGPRVSGGDELAAAVRGVLLDAPVFDDGSDPLGAARALVAALRGALVGREGELSPTPSPAR